MKRCGAIYSGCKRGDTTGMKTRVLLLTYIIFFFSGAAALIYEVVWTRYLSLVFGGSHLAVTTVLTIFMAGLAVGSYFIGRVIDGKKRLLRLFGLLELGVGVSAVLFFGLMQIYPAVYSWFAGFNPESSLYLSFLRITFAVVALIIPTTLMGGTLPVLTAFSTRLMRGAGIRLSFLYGCNTLGAVCGAAATGFLLLRVFSMSKTLAVAVVINLCVGVGALLVQKMLVVGGDDRDFSTETDSAESMLLPEKGHTAKLVLWGMGVSGFCAMGYEVLWNRVLSIAVGASTYGFTLLLMAFLSGIASGSATYGLFLKLYTRVRQKPVDLKKLLYAFSAVQLTIGCAALLATLQFRNLPGYVTFLHSYFGGTLPHAEQFHVLQLANLTLAFSVMFVPALFMGAAFPLAGEIYCRCRQSVGSAVGEVLSMNTIGAILGAGVSGYLFVYFLGVQRSIQLLILINIGYGIVTAASATGRKHLIRVTATAALSALLLPVFAADRWQLWDPRLYAVYQSNKPEEFGTGDEASEMLANMEVRYYHEGAQSIVSAVQSAETLFFITNGRVEASNAHEDMQCQYVLGHLPMLLHKKPQHVFVLGTGSGMTLGSVSVHPSVERITLAEIEPGVLGVARTFGINNHYILNRPDPRLKVVFNDGRNHLLTTRERYDVITADPVHPWFSGSGYLYSSEYFRLASQRLRPGGILCQWLPLYELTEENLQSVVRTIREHFAYTMVWVTHYDAEIIASNSPIIIDEQELGRRFAVPEIISDLRQVKMGTAEDFLSFFLMGSEGTKAYSRNGTINTDDNLYLELSAPRSIGMEYLRSSNLAALFKYREKLTGYLQPGADQSTRQSQVRRWEDNYRAALLEDRAHLLNVSGGSMSYEYHEIATELENRYPRYAPWRFARSESGEPRGGRPEVVKEIELTLLDEAGKPFKADLMAVLVRKDSRFARVFFVDDTTRTVFGKLRVKGSGRNEFIHKFIDSAMNEARWIYHDESAAAAAAGNAAPSLLTVFPKIKTMVEERIEAELL